MKRTVFLLLSFVFVTLSASSAAPLKGDVNGDGAVDVADLAAIIDVDGVQQTIVADCKFRSGKIDSGALKAFLNRAEQISDVPEKHLMMFSISGFEDKLIKKARADHVVLIGPDELL